MTRRNAGRIVAAAALIAAPWIVAAALPGQQRYLLHILIFTCLYGALAVSYDLVVGRVGSLSLAHAAFFGIGAYAAALLATEAGWPFPAGLAAAVVAAGLAAVLVGFPAFRLAEHSFAIGTLGFAIVTQLVANNWVEFTKGPLCVTGIPKPQIGLPFGPRLQIATLPRFYWMSLALLVLVALLYRRLTAFRIGRAFTAVRDNEVLAAAAGINPLTYRMLAFGVGAALAGGVGAVYAHYISVLCPSELGIGLTANLLVMLFLGGVGSLRGVLAGAALFTALPEVLRLAPTWRLVIYGVLLLVIVVRAPGGLEAVIARAGRRRAPVG
jgi:ABC-type branched-subunit amino acid transport system permease subunit